MNKAPHLRTDLLGSELPAVVVWLAALICLAAWVGAHALSRRCPSGKLWRAGCLAVRVLAGVLALWAFWQAVARHLVLETIWSLWLNAWIGALAVEAAFGLYALEKHLVSARMGKWLTGLRVTAILAVLTMLVQPVFSRREIRRIDRNVVVLLDESESMQQADSAMPVEERLALADFLGLPGLDGRPELSEKLSEGAGLAEKLEAAIESVRPPDGINEADARALVERERENLTRLLQELQTWVDAMVAALDNQRETVRRMPQALRLEEQQLRKLLSDLARDSIAPSGGAVERGEGRRLRATLREGVVGLGRIAGTGPVVAAAADEAYYQSLPEAARAAMDAAASRPRRELVLEAITRGQNGNPSVLEQLRQKYTVRFMTFGKEAIETPELPGAPTPGAAIRSRTDLALGLAKVQEVWPSENLAGVVLLSDARHNGPVPPDDAARRLGLQGSPLGAVVVGSAAGARDAAIAEVVHPRSIFLGDRLRVSVDLKADRLRGEQIKVQLLREDEVVREETVMVTGDAMRTTLRMDDTPPEKGIFKWKVRIDPVANEQFSQNNEWAFEAAVSDDRTNVLLIDDRPRWEFRYLRNLFDSRDKSVQLQYVLLNPDQVAGADPLPVVPAAAGRPFGESEATRLPVSEEEWRKFDVIILGDVPPDVLDEKTWQVIRGCVGERGAMLVLVAGQNYLPHAYAHEVARELIPLKFTPSTAVAAVPPEPAWQLELTAAGRQSPVFSQSASGLENARIWERMPVMRWRHGHDGVKEGAEVLAWARPVPVDSQGVELEGASDFASSGDAATELQRRRRMEQENAVVVSAQVDLGKVVMLAFDQTWRFRYGTGDTYHHRFWGQLLRWGAGESLPSGTPSVRLGTDLLTYDPGAPITVRARLRQEDSRPLQDAEVKVTLFREDQVITSRRMDYRRDSQGLYETKLEGISEPGTYRVELSGSGVEQLSASAGAATVSQPITIGTNANAVELGDLTVDQEMANRLASLSRGVVTGLPDAERVVSLFGPGTREVEERRETSLWDNWILLAVAVGAMTTEWILRRRSPLA